jgi:hypothetical protein
VLVDDAVVLAETLELADLPSIDARADVDRAIAAHRAAAIAAANTATRHTAALDHSHASNARAHLVSRFACWAAQTISGLVIEGQRAAVRAHAALKAAAAARAAAPPPISPEERRALTTLTTLGGTRTVHVRRVTLLLAGETAPRHARVRAAAAAAAANSGPIGTIGLR